MHGCGGEFWTVDSFFEIPACHGRWKHSSLSPLLLSESQSQTDSEGDTHTHVCKYKSIFGESNIKLYLKN
jgi:hypothetical protein